MYARHRIDEETAGRPFTMAQAARWGLDRHAVTDLVRAGVLRNPLYGVYVGASTADDVRGRVRAAALVLPPGGAIARTTAAWLHGLDVRPPGEHLAAPPLECLVERGVQPVRRPGLRCYAAELARGDVEGLQGVPVTTPVRTVVDLLRWSRCFVGLGAADAFAHAGLVDPQHVADEVERWRGCPGAAKARRLAAVIEPATESPGESWQRLRFLDAGLPRPAVQVSLRSEADEEVWRLDHGWYEVAGTVVRKAAEYDGVDYHSRRPDQDHDASRRDAIRRRFGWEVVGFTKEAVLGRSMDMEWQVALMLGIEPKTNRRLW